MTLAFARAQEVSCEGVLIRNQVGGEFIDCIMRPPTPSKSLFPPPEELRRPPRAPTFHGQHPKPCDKSSYRKVSARSRAPISRGPNVLTEPLRYGREGRPSALVGRQRA